MCVCVCVKIFVWQGDKVTLPEHLEYPAFIYNVKWLNVLLLTTKRWSHLSHFMWRVLKPLSANASMIEPNTIAQWNRQRVKMILESFWARLMSIQGPWWCVICLYTYIHPPPLTMSLGCVMLTCHTFAFVLCLLVFSCLVLLHHFPHSFLCHVSSDEESARRDNRKLWQSSPALLWPATTQYVGLSAAAVNISMLL